MPIIADIYRKQNDQNGEGWSFFDGHSRLLIANIAPEVEIHNAEQFPVAIVTGPLLAGASMRVVPAEREVDRLADFPRLLDGYVMIDFPTFGGAYVMSSDPRWSFENPLPLHDWYADAPSR